MFSFDGSCTSHTVILADGEQPSHRVALRIFRTAEKVVVCDGAWRTSLALGRIPDAVVGDGDSLGSDDIAELGRLGVCVFRDPEQDTNDLCKAFRHVVRSGAAGRIFILGATGKREDHAIGNIFHLLDLASVHPDISIVTDSGVFEPVLPPGKTWDDASATDTPISIFASHPDATMESEGLKWPLRGVRFDALWRGTLNRILSPRFSVSTDRPALVFRPHSSNAIC